MSSLRELIREQIKYLKESRKKPTTYIIKPGDTLGAIAIKHDVTVDQIIKANPDLNLELLKPKTEINIPGGFLQSNNDQIPSKKLIEWLKYEEGMLSKSGPNGKHWPKIYDDAIPYVGGKPNYWKGGNPKGNLTYGWGKMLTRSEADSFLKSGKTLSEQEAETMLKDHVWDASGPLRNSVREPGYDRLVIPFLLSQGQFDALTSIIYNAGSTNFQSSDLYRKYISQGNPEEADYNVFEKTCVDETDSGQKGLKKDGEGKDNLDFGRRDRESMMFQHGTYKTSNGKFL